MNEDLKDLLERLRDYMDDRSDADWDGEQYRPNEEMKFLHELNLILEC